MDCALWTLKATVCQNVRHVTGFGIKQLQKCIKMQHDANLNTHACLNSHALMHAYSYCWFNCENVWLNLSGMMTWSEKETAVFQTAAQGGLKDSSVAASHFLIDQNIMDKTSYCTMTHKEWPTNSVPSSLPFLFLFLPISLIPGC